MNTSEFEYYLPPELIAQQPPPNRTDARLMIVRRASGTLEHRHVADLPELLSGDKTPAANGKTRYWRSCGMGLQDMAVSKALYDVLKA